MSGASDVALDEALQELEAAEQPTGSLISKALSAMADFFKGAKKDGGKSGKDRLDDLMDEYDLDDDDDDDLGDPDDDEDDGDQAPPARGRVRKALSEGVAADGEEYAAVIAGDELLKSILDNVDERLEDRDQAVRSELKTVRKALAGVLQTNKELREQLGSIGKRPAGSAAPYRVLEKGAGERTGRTLPTQEQALAKAESALRKGIITPGERRTVELAYEVDRPADAWHVLRKLEYSGVE